MTLLFCAAAGGAAEAPDASTPAETPHMKSMRSLIREQSPDMPKSGQYQYPDSSTMLFSHALSEAKNEAARKRRHKKPEKEGTR